MKGQTTMAKTDDAVKLDEFGLMTMPAGRSDIIERLKSGEWEAEKLISLEEGDSIEGVYLGEGDPVEITVPQTGEVRIVKTHRFRFKGTGIIGAIMGSAKLNAKLPHHVGEEVYVEKEAQTNTRAGNRVNNFLIATKRKS